MNTERRIEILTQNRAEELLLELISERVAKGKPTDPKQLDDVNDHYRGYVEGWWDCYQQLQDAISNHNEGNDFRK